MKFIATIFCAAAVLIPIFQIDTACTDVIIKSDASLLSLLTLKAAIIPSKMGTTAPARAVAEGTKRLIQLILKLHRQQYFCFISYNRKNIKC